MIEIIRKGIRGFDEVEAAIAGVTMIFLVSGIIIFHDPEYDTVLAQMKAEIHALELKTDLVMISAVTPPPSEEAMIEALSGDRTPAEVKPVVQ